MNVFLAAAFLLSPAAFAADAYQSPVEVYNDIVPVLDGTISEIEICVQGSCEIFDVAQFERKGGLAETIYYKPKEPGDAGQAAAKAVGDIIGQIGGKAGVGGRVVVEYEHTKNKDGSEKTKVKVEVSAGAGTAAEGAVQK